MAQVLVQFLCLFHSILEPGHLALQRDCILISNLCLLLGSLLPCQRPFCLDLLGQHNLLCLRFSLGSLV